MDVMSDTPARQILAVVDGQDRPHWLLLINDVPELYLPRSTPTPPFAVTEGLRFFEMHDDTGELVGWGWNPPRDTTRLFWLLMSIAGVCIAVAAVWKPAVIAGLVAIVAAVAIEVRK